MYYYTVYKDDEPIHETDKYVSALINMNEAVGQVLDDYMDECIEKYGVHQLFHIERNKDTVVIAFNEKDSVIFRIEDWRPQ